MLRQTGRGERLLWLAMVALLCLMQLTSPALANAGPPPRLIVQVYRPPDELRMFFDGTEGYHLEYEGGDYWIFTDDFPQPGGTSAQEPGTLRVEHAKGQETLTLALTQHYDSRYRLNLDTMELRVGRGPVFSLTHYGLRLAVTLLIEGLLLFLFGFRQKRSYIVFLVVNALTQLALGLVLANSTLPVGSGAYGRFLLVPFMELIIIAVEAWVYVHFLAEHGKRRRIGFAVLANLASWLLGSYLMYNVFHLQEYIL